MIQCKDCEYCQMGPQGQVQLLCNPFGNIREAECLVKWQLLRLDLMTRAYMATVAEYKKIAPLQEKLYRHMSREMEDMDESDRWKYGDDAAPGRPDDEGPDAEEGLGPLDDRL